MDPLLAVEDLRVHYPGPRGPVRAVDGLSFAVWRGETYALVGESGCGKSATAMATVKLVEPGEIAGGRIVLDGRELTPLTEKQMRPVRGGRIGVVFQEASAALNPVMRVGAQIVETIRAHRDRTRKQAWAEAVQWLERVALPEPERQARAYPHELSGGMKQRVMIAIALAAGPELLIADEPTTALDVTIQAQVLELIRRLKRELELTVLLITHDLGVVAENADRVGVMYAGRLVEEAAVDALFAAPLHPYTRALMEALPEVHEDGATGTPLAGQVPDPAAPPPGCRFHPRCPDAVDACSRDDPPLEAVDGGRRLACLVHGPAGKAAR